MNEVVDDVRQVFLPGTVIVREGEPGISAYIIERGLVEVKALREGKQITLAILGEGELFGEMALIDDVPRVATVVALEETEVTVLNRLEVKTRLGTADALVSHLLTTLLRRFRALHSRLTGATEDPDAGDMLSAPAFVGSIPSMTMTPTIPAFDRGRLAMELQSAISSQAIKLKLLPVVRLSDGTKVGYETSLHWTSMERGEVSPQQLAGFAEQSGLSRALDSYALQQAVFALRRRLAAGGDPPFIGVRVHGGQFRDNQIVTTLKGILAGGQRLPDGALRLIIDENAMLGDPTIAGIVLQNVRNIGIGIDLGHFGTGYSSLGFVDRFGIDRVHIDETFIETLDVSDRSKRLVRAACELAKACGADAIASGVTTEAQRAALRDLGCAMGQGPLFGDAE